MTLQQVWAIQGDSHPAVLATSAMAAAMGVPVAAHSAAVAAMTAGGGHGVVGSGDFAVTQNGTPNMSVNVAAGYAFVRSGGSASILVGIYALLNDATVNVSISASDPTNPRIDLVIVQVRDSNYGEAASDERITVVAGTPAASPAVPSLTSYPNCVVLAQVAVAAAVTTIVTANITDKRTFAYGVGGKAYAKSTQRPSGASLRQGLGLSESDTFEELVYYSAAGVWRRPWMMPWGLVAIGTSAGDVTTSGTTVKAISTTPTFTAYANRRYKTTFVGVGLGSVVADIFALTGRVTDIAGATSFLPSTQFAVVEITTGRVPFSVVSSPYTLAAGSYVAVGCVARATGTGTLRVDYGAGGTVFFIEDIGPANATPA